VSDCELIGDVTASTQDRVRRNLGRGKVAEELIVLTRNEAAALAGDTLLRALIGARRAPRNHPGVHPCEGPARYHGRRSSGESKA